MNRWISQIRTPVRRQGTDTYLLLMLLSFAASVALTRLFLKLTGYPQLGGGTIHIAHVLWGGMLLFVAALLPLVFANRWVYTTGAVVAGLGIGLFIDELGKFITQANDYFYPPAAPIIYAFFLVTVLLYLQVRRPASRDARAELYHALEALEEVLDHDLAEDERADLEARLHVVATSSDRPDLVRLANLLHGFLTSDSLHLAPDLPTSWERLQTWARTLEGRWARRPWLRAFLVFGLGSLSVLALAKLAMLLLASSTPGGLERRILELVAVGQVASAGGLSWFSARLALEGAVGMLLLLAAGLLVAGKERLALGLGYLGLLLSLTTVNLLLFYFDQFSTIVLAAAQFVVLLTLLYYRRRFRPR